ncbi:hypothetical protein FQN57_003329 [Myotisia sp. PD_48]|nr:hypothetical protein FQN57_003329 [Myotisia sp. PD_48]
MLLSRVGRGSGRRVIRKARMAPQWTAIVIIAALGLFANGVKALDNRGELAPFGPLGPNACPIPCNRAGDNSSTWTQYHNANQLLACKGKPKMLDFSIRTPLDRVDKPSIIRACTSFEGEKLGSQVSQLVCLINSNANDGGIRSLGKSATMHLDVAWTNTTKPVIPDQVMTAAKEVQAALFHESTNKSSYIVSHYGDSVVGMYVGARIGQRGIATTVVQNFVDLLTSSEAGEQQTQTLVLQHCAKDGKGIDSDYVVGMIGDASRGLSSLVMVQRAMEMWSKAQCVDSLVEHAAPFGETPVWLTNTSIIPMSLSGKKNNDNINKNNNTNNNNNNKNDQTQGKNNHNERSLEPRADCRTIQVVSGDSCASLAEKCGISGADFTKYNPGSNVCSSLRVGQHVCCSSGTLPDRTPKPDPDGTCATYIVQNGDWCDKIASSHGLTVDNLESLNKNTWGWSGCERMYAGIKMCLSKGDPPMPEPIANAVCGPQKPGTKKPKDIKDLADLNPCPLKGQCGITEDFCIKSSLGPPGTSEPGKNGCISNCGLDLVNNKVPPKEFIRVGYFEAWNLDRKCLHMYVLDMDAPVTHIHFAFGDVNEKFQVSIEPVRLQFKNFLKMKHMKRILAFGGWTASTSPSSYWIFREGVKPENRERLATNLANFIKEYNLDGIDLDWEYPAVPDLPGIPTGDPIDGPNYLELLKLIRKKLPGKTLSIAAPASYWYLKAFPIEEIAKVVDYIVYMTYDLHGQWDYGNSYSSPGCPEGNCLRSHVNVTETYNSLVMVTKAGVPSNKIVVGVSSYGRSFKMAEAGCTGSNCRFTGPNSEAKPGRCTDTSGYISNAEINEIIDKNPGAIRTWKDGSSSNILVYDDVQWVAYMDDAEKLSRKKRWEGLNFAGLTDWAVDLQVIREYEPEPGDPPIDPAQRWTDIKCNHWAANDTERNPRSRWAGLHAQEAWDEAIVAWKIARDQETTLKSFTDFIRSNCDTTHMCIQSDNSGPAASLILNSFVPIWASARNLNAGIEKSQLDIATTFDAFVEIFSPPEKNDLWFNLLMNFLNMATIGIAAPVFTNILNSGKYYGSGMLETLKDDSYAMAAFIFSSAKDAKAAGNINLDASKTLSILFASLAESWQDLITINNENIFNRSDISIRTLDQLISDGKLIESSVIDTSDTTARVKRVMYSYLIPAIWSLKEFYSVVIETGEDCDTVGKATLDPKEPKDIKDWSISRFALTTRKDFGNKKEDSYPDLDKEIWDKMHAILDGKGSKMLPGMVNIPVCGPDEVIDNWKRKQAGQDQLNMRVSTQLALVAFIPALVLSQKVEQSLTRKYSLFAKREDFEKCYGDPNDKTDDKGTVCYPFAAALITCVYGISIEEADEIERTGSWDSHEWVSGREQKECICPKERFWNGWKECSNCLKAEGEVEGGQGWVGERYRSAFSSAYCAETQNKPLYSFETGFFPSFVATVSTTSPGWSEKTPTPVSSQGFALAMPTPDARLSGLVGAGIAIAAGFL